MHLFDDHTTGMHWHIHKTGARHYEAYKRLGIRRMPVSVCLGGDPACTYAATAPMPEGMDEYLLAGFLRRRPVRLVKCVTNELWVPADCDFVLEGWIDTTEEPRIEGPFGDHTGFYSLEDPYPVFHLEAITHRRDAIWPATVVGVPPQEDAWFAAATERIFLPPIRYALQPEVHDLHMPPAGVAHNLAIVAMDVSYAGQSGKVANALWGAGQMMFNKVLVAAPDGFPIRDPEAVMGLLRGVDPARDLVFGHGVLDVLDHATATPGVGGKLLIDATRADAEQSENNFQIIFDPAAEELTPYEQLWLGLANIDPARDITVADGVATVDCRAKNGGAKNGGGFPSRWPNVVVMDEATVALVDSRWPEYGLGGFLPSPSTRYRKLLLSDGAGV
jgi:4-hydroxy-3-polyprenylbenzoate decarboxylase